jgi:hypothetical protein
MRAPRNPLDGYAKAASNNFNTGVATILSSVDSFQAVLAQTSFKAFNKTVLLECLVNKLLLQ